MASSSSSWFRNQVRMNDMGFGNWIDIRQDSDKPEVLLRVTKAGFLGRREVLKNLTYKVGFFYRKLGIVLSESKNSSIAFSIVVKSNESDRWVVADAGQFSMHCLTELSDLMYEVETWMDSSMKEDLSPCDRTLL